MYYVVSLTTAVKLMQKPLPLQLIWTFCVLPHVKYSHISNTTYALTEASGHCNYKFYLNSDLYLEDVHVYTVE